MAVPPIPFRPSRCAQATAFAAAPATLTTVGILGGSALFGLSLPVSLLGGAAFLGFSQLFSRILTGGEVLRPAVFFTNDTLGDEKMIMGGFVSNNIPFYLEVLEGMDAEDANMAKSCLSSALQFERNFSDLGIGNKFLIQDLLKHINGLRPGQKTAFSLGWKNVLAISHVVFASIEREESGRFRVRLHNKGQECGRHHNTQATLEIGEIEDKNLAVFLRKALSLRTLHLADQGRAIYNALLLLEGIFKGSSKDPKDEEKNHNGMSCSGYSIRCFLKTVLSPESFLQFEERLINQSIIRLQKRMEQGSFLDNCMEHRTAYNALCAKRPDLNITPIDVNKVSFPSRYASNIHSVWWNFYFTSPLLTKIRERLGPLLKSKQATPLHLIEKLLEEEGVPKNFLDLPEDWKKSREVMSRIVQRSPRFLAQVAKELRDDPDFLEPLLVQQFSDERPWSEDVSRISIGTGCWSALWKNKQFALRCIAKDPRTIFWFGKERKDPDIVQALKAQASVDAAKVLIRLGEIDSISQEQLADPVIFTCILSDTQFNSSSYAKIFNAVKNNRPLLLTFLEVVFKENPYFFPTLPLELRGDLEIVGIEIKYNAWNIDYASEAIQMSIEALLSLIAINPSVYSAIRSDNPLGQNRDLALAALRQNRFISPHDTLRDDPEIRAILDAPPESTRF